MKMMMMKRERNQLTLSLALLGGLLLAPLQAGGQPAADATDRARALFEKAQIHFSLKEFNQAIKLNKEAYRIKQLPALLFNIGQCYRSLNDCQNTIFYFREYLVQQPTSRQKADVEQMIKDCEVTLASKPRLAPSTATSLPVGPPKAQRTTKIHARSDAPESGLRLASQPASGATTDSTQPTHRGPARIWLWSGVGLSAALLATSAVTGAMVYSKNNEYKDLTTPVERRKELKDSGQPLAVTSVATLGLGAAAAVATGLYYWFSYRRSARATISAIPLTGAGATLLCSGDF